MEHRTFLTLPGHHRFNIVRVAPLLVFSLSLFIFPFLTVVLIVLPITAYDYSFGMFKLSCVYRDRW